MRRWRTWVSLSVLLVFCGYGTAVLLPVFASARAATRMTDEIRDTRKFEQAIQRDTEAHHGRLPGKDWKTSITAIDPSIKNFLDRREGEWSTGLAAIPNSLGKQLDDLPAETILFVGYQSSSRVDVLENTADLGDLHRIGNMVVLDAGCFFDGGNLPFKSVGRVGYLLAKQGVKLE